MRPAALAEVARILGANLATGDGATLVRGAATDSRVVREGDLFFALRGRTDGADFAPEAYLRGAVAAVATRPLEVPTLVVGDPLEAMQRLARWTLRRDDAPQVVGITGTVGKTTTKDALATVLRYAGRRVSATAGNYNNEIGLPLTVLGADPRTEILVLEMGATHPGDIRHLCAIAPPKVGILTAISPVHLDSFGSLDSLAAAKGELALALPESGTLVSPVAAPEAATGSGRPLRRRITFGAAEGADLTASGVDEHEKGLGWGTGRSRFAPPSSGHTSSSRCWQRSAGGLRSEWTWRKAPEASPACDARACGVRYTGCEKTSWSMTTPTTPPRPPSSPCCATERTRPLGKTAGSSPSSAACSSSAPQLEPTIRRPGSSPRRRV